MTTDCGKLKSIKFLVNCSNDSVAPKFLNFRAATKSLKSRRTYKQYQLSLLHEEIRQKKYNIRVLLKEFKILHSTLQAYVSSINFAHVRSLFLGHNKRDLEAENYHSTKEIQEPTER